MPTDIDIPPLYDPITRYSNDKLSEIWVGWFATFYETLDGYLSQSGIFIPALTTDQRDALQDVQNGQMIYNTTLGKFQGYEAGTWKTFTTV